VRVRPLFAFVGVIASCNGRGAPGVCQTARDCASGEACVAGSCIASRRALGCRSDGECGAGEWCDPADRACKAVLPAALDAGTQPGVPIVPPMEDAGSPDPTMMDASAPIDTGVADAGATVDTGLEDAGAPADMGAPDSGSPSGCVTDADCTAPSTVCNAVDGRCLPANLAQGDQTCLIDAQCASGMCLGLTLGAQSIQVCTDPCGATAECPIDFACLPVSGMGFCLSEMLFNPPATFDTPAGGSCTTTTNTCQTGWCNTGVSQCIETCSRNTDCAAFGGNCWTYTQTNMGTSTYDHLCVPQATASAAGAVCAANTDCQSGICDRYDGKCARHCCADQDCPAGDTCTVYDLDASNAVKVCIARSPTAGTAALGAPCTTYADCESEACASVDPDDPNSPRKCSTTCCRDQDCSVLPLGGHCRPAGTGVGTQITGLCQPM
jgi:hypothetical protein